MGDHDVKMEDTTENTVPTAPVSPATDAALPPHPNTSARHGCRNHQSAAWDHYTVEPGFEKKAKCNYCGCLIKYAHGTGAMNSHLNGCKAYPNIEGHEAQKIVPSTSEALPSADEQVPSFGSSPDLFEFHQEKCRSALVKMFVIDELPLWLVERESFRELMNMIQPMFEVPSRVELLRDIVTLFNGEKIKLREYLSSHCRSVCLIIDTWTSCRNLNYVSLTAQFVDNDWKVQKKVLNIFEVPSHSGEFIAKSIKVCLKSWDLNEVVSLTVDNVLSNDLGIQHLKDRLISCNSVILSSECIHVRCYAHILSLIEKEGLKEIGDSVLRIRGAVKCIRSSPSRLAKFKECVEHEKIQSDLVCLDVETQWNSTYLMLEAAVKHQKAFELLMLLDTQYVEELNGEEEKGVPSEDDWQHARSLLPFLEMFYGSAMRIFSTSGITSDIYMKEVFGIGRMIYHYFEHNDLSIRLMASKMKNHYVNYWGNPNAMNMLLLIAVVLDPRLKLDYPNWYLDYFFDSEKANELKLKLFSCLWSIYNYYQGTEGSRHDQQDA